MKKELIKFYKIKEMRQQGLSYVERGQKISEMKKKYDTMGIMLDGIQDKQRIITTGSSVIPDLTVELSRWEKFIVFLKKVFYGSHKSKNQKDKDGSQNRSARGV